MIKIYQFLIVIFLIGGCKEIDSSKTDAETVVAFNQELVDEMRKMVEIDQIAAYIPQGEYKKLSREEWSFFKDSVFTNHQKRVEEIFKQYGFTGFDLVGKEGSSNFWVMVQHSDHKPEFQKEVLEKMKIEVEKQNAEPSNYALLVDRVKLNTGQKQVYGTQVDYNMEICQAFPKNLGDSLNVNKRRKKFGLKPLEEYLNSMTKMNFEMNKEYYKEKGVTEPKLYIIE